VAALNESDIRGIVEQVVKNMLRKDEHPASGTASAVPAPSTGGIPPSARPPRAFRGVFDTVDEAVAAAAEAFRVLCSMTLAQRAGVIAAIRRCGCENARSIAEETLRETGMGRVEHKVQKMLTASNKTPGIEDLKTDAWSGDYGLTTEEMAPWGVIAAVTPSTHPVPTLVNNAISMIAAGNAVVFAPHPASKNVFMRAVGLFNDAIVAAGGPENLIATMSDPTIERAQELFYHPGARLLVVTGGPGVVKAAMKVPKRVIAAGPGNPPVVVDETADIQQAVADIIEGAAFENNIICTAEKEVFVVDSVFDLFMREMGLQGMIRLEAHQIEALAREAFTTGKGAEPVLNRDLVGRNACVLAERVGLRLSDDVPLLFGETAADHIFVMEEQMMPFLPVVRVPAFHAALECAVRSEGGRGHTAMIHSRNIEHMHEMARRVNTTIFVKNGSCLAGLGVGGEGTSSFTISTPTGEGVTTARTFTRRRRCTLKRYFHIT